MAFDLTADLTTQFKRDLDRLATEIKAYSNESDLWTIRGEIKNSGGNLSLHLIGNLRHFIGHVIGGTDYVRQREQEFSAKDVPSAAMLEELEQCKTEIESALAAMTEEDQQAAYPFHVFGNEMTTGFFLLHLLGHLNYHLGQINYHRRLQS